MKVVISVVLLQLVALLLCDTVVSMDGNGHHHGYHGHGKYFLSRVSLLTRDIDIANLSVRLSVLYVPVSDENGLTYRHSFFFTIR